YFFYYRYYDVDLVTWNPWEKIQIDIPSYDVVDSTTYLTVDNGCYLVPVVFKSRLLLFFPQISKKTVTSPDNSNTFNTGTNITVKYPVDYWEIKMAWSEYRNGKWTQKQISKESILTNPIDSRHDIQYLKFVPFVQTDSVLISIDDYLDNTPDGGFWKTFEFQGSQLFPTTLQNTTDPIPINYFNNSNTDDMFSWQIDGGGHRVNTGLYAEDDLNSTTLWGVDNFSSVPFYHPYAHQMLGQINQDDLIEFFECNPNTPDNAISKTNTPDPTFSSQQMFGSTTDEAGNNVFDELKAPYSIYNWELFFHLPASLAGALSGAQQFENAMNWYHYVFNPLIDKGADDHRWWRFVPFQQTDAVDYLTTLFNSLKPNTPDDKNGQINQWRDNPFNPHAIARQRPSAYMKWTVMKYLDNLIAWGDYLFTQHTIESINQATQLYIFASHILGPRPQIIPKRGKIKPETYNSLLGKWDAFSNAVVELELVFPFSNQIADPSEINPNDGELVYPNIFGFASALYFCIPSNPELIAYWDTVEDRLFKIRHCENIEGIFSLPPLWDPPIDPALLVQAAAQGLSLDAVLSDLSNPLPNYRFGYLVAKSIEICNELKSMGASLLSAFEKKDGEALSKMKASQELTINNLVMEVKKKQLDEASAALDGLTQNRLSPVYRMQHYLNLLGEDLGQVPTADNDFSPLADTIETISGDSGLKLIPFEKEEMDQASSAQDTQVGVGIIETLASIFHALPLAAADVKPIGIGVGLGWGGSNLGNLTQAIGRAVQIKASDQSFQSAQAQRKAGFLRQMQERVLQANIAGYEIKQIDKQILTQQVRIDLANQEITNQQQMIDNANETLEFLTDKYTNEELYGWFIDNTKSLYYQLYKLAYDLAKKAEKIYCFERGLSTSNFIQYGYWDAGHDGLLSGERLFLGIKQLESAYQQDRGYDYEITKHISLRQLDPLALLQVRENGVCEFEVPEVLFDMDFPGHYMRKIKTVALSIPCIVGPYAGVNGTLRLLQNKFRTTSLANGSYPESTDQADPRFSTVNVPITAIATSNGQNDSGTFELNFRDERYLPFEGAGAISSWKLELPAAFMQFNYETISDVILHLRYTSIDGGDGLKTAAGKFLTSYVKSVDSLGQEEGLFVIFDLRHDYPNEWYKNFGITPVPAGRIMTLGNLVPRLPYFTQGFKVSATDVFIAATSSLKNTDVNLVSNGNALDAFGGPVKVNSTMNLFSITGLAEPMNNWAINIADTAATPDSMWMIVRYTLST
ncbi:MAG TPA: neuraminidase-like domain-containing protein, partial [Puia sp.]|nr:neuraminidase-like domain-containing protein [Puia sp.]